MTFYKKEAPHVSESLHEINHPFIIHRLKLSHTGLFINNLHNSRKWPRVNTFISRVTCLRTFGSFPNYILGTSNVNAYIYCLQKYKDNTELSFLLFIYQEPIGAG